MEMRLLLLLLLLSHFASLFGQSADLKVFSASGVSNQQVSYTIGEPITSTLIASNSHLTQGFHQTNLNIVSIEERADASSVIIYPNPTQDDFSVLYNGMENNLNISLLDYQGKEIIKKYTNSNNTKIDVSNLAVGVYIIVIQNTHCQIISKHKLTKI